MITSEDIDRIAAAYLTDRHPTFSDASPLPDSHDEEIEDEGGFERHLQTCENCGLFHALKRSSAGEAFLREAAYQIADGNDSIVQALVRALCFGYHIGLRHQAEIAQTQADQPHPTPSPTS